jgi:hypothetical protein
LPRPRGFQAELLADEAAHLLVADAGDQRRMAIQPEPRASCADGIMLVGQPPTDLAKKAMSSSREPICWP